MFGVFQAASHVLTGKQLKLPAPYFFTQS
jgi:brefeldin A-inhibited guanine nucleotide-exchange protein